MGDTAGARAADLLPGLQTGSAIEKTVDVLKQTIANDCEGDAQMRALNPAGKPQQCIT